MAWRIGLEILLEALNESEGISTFCGLHTGIKDILPSISNTDHRSNCHLRRGTCRLLRDVSSLPGVVVG
jgi:hypothetical protein